MQTVHPRAAPSGHLSSLLLLEGVKGSVLVDEQLRAVEVVAKDADKRGAVGQKPLQPLRLLLHPVKTHERCEKQTEQGSSSSTECVCKGRCVCVCVCV